MDTFWDTIQKYDNILIYRHIQPDFDALGSQYGLASMIQQLYPSKKVYLKGEKNHDLFQKMNIQYHDDLPQDMHNSLAIVLDTANHERIDSQDYKQCDYILKVDHHIIVDSFGDTNIECPNKSSTSQIIAELYMNHHLTKLNKDAATLLYYGMIADSNRFLYRNTDASTMQAASYLLECGIDIDKIYQNLYTKSEKDLQIHRYILNHYQRTKQGVAYYILTTNDLNTLNISRSKGSDFVNILANIEEYPIWLAVTQNDENNTWRVSIRSRNIAINEIATKYHGGGHQLAAGATLSNIQQLDSLLKDLDNLIQEYHL